MDQIILFDGICNLCCRSVSFVIRHDPYQIFRFTTLQSEAGKKILTANGLEQKNLQTFILLQNGKVFTRSTAALLVAKQLTGPVKLLYTFIILPYFLRDPVYNLIAANRFRWFGKRSDCLVPTPDIQNRFLTEDEMI